MGGATRLANIRSGPCRNAAAPPSPVADAVRAPEKVLVPYEVAERLGISPASCDGVQRDP